MTSGPVVGLELKKNAAIHDWRLLLGPTNTMVFFQFELNRLSINLKTLIEIDFLF